MQILEAKLHPWEDSVLRIFTAETFEYIRFYSICASRYIGTSRLTDRRIGSATKLVSTPFSSVHMLREVLECVLETFTRGNFRKQT